MNHQQQLQKIIDDNLHLGEAHCAYKLWYNNKYVVVSGKTFARSLSTIKNDLKRVFNQTEMSLSEKNIYAPFYTHVYANPNDEFSVEFWYTGANPYQMLKHAQLALSSVFYDDECLNTYRQPYIPPSTNAINNKSWINRGYYLNFRKWKKHVAKHHGPPK